MNPFFVTDFSISDSLKTVRKSVLIYETIILIQTHLNSTNNSVVVLHKNASFRNLKIMTTKKL